MALRGVKPKTTEKRLKALFYGAAGVGKTTAAINFPKPYLIDTEKGSVNDQYVDIINKNGGCVFHCHDFEDLVSEIMTLLTEKHEYKTLIIDPLTTLYSNLLEQYEKAKSIGSEFGRHYAEANKRMKHLVALLTRLDMNVIVTSHAKSEYSIGTGANGKKEMVLIGQTFDCYKKLDYLFDLVFEIQKRGKERVGVVKKTRIESFSDLESFPFSYDEIANRYGREVLERDAIAQVLASKEQVQEIKSLIDLLKVSEETYQKWLSKSDSERFEEMPSDSIQKCIDFLRGKINTHKLEAVA